MHSNLINNIKYNNINTQIKNLIQPEMNLREKIKQLESICLPETPRGLIKCAEFPIWVFLLEHGHFDLFKMFSQDIKENNKNLSFFLSMDNSLEFNLPWFPKDNFEEIIKNNIFCISPSNMDFAIQNKLLKNPKQTLIDIGNNIKTSFQNFITFQDLFPVGIKMPGVRISTFNILANNYYNETKDVYPLKVCCESLIKSSALLEITRFDQIYRISGQFRQEFLGQFISQPCFMTSEIFEPSRLFTDIIKNNEFKEYKINIYQKIIKTHPEMLSYGFFTNYFTHEDLLNFMTDSNLKMEMEKYELEQKIPDNDKKKKVRM